MSRTVAPVIAKVEPLTSARSLRGPFDYRLPEAMDGEVGVGSVLVVPFARRKILAVVTALAATSEIAPDKLAEPLEHLDGAVPDDLVELGLWVAREYCSTPARGLALVTPPGTGTGAGARSVKAKQVLHASITEAGTLALGDAAARLTAGQRAALECLERSGVEGMPTATVAEHCGADVALLRRLEGRALVTIEQRDSRRAPHHEAIGALREDLQLTAAQQSAQDTVVAAIGGGHAEFLLHGVTGSGKTEVYLGAAEAALAAGRGAIVMVPEIALTPQTVTRFNARFGDRIAVLHSKLTAGQRRDEWMRLRSGEARICVGPRSAVFAPVRDLGLVVVDEEHDASYKQESDPRYDAREVADRRARAAGAVLVAGSATPRPESWRAMRRLSLPLRVDGSTPPPVALLDMRGISTALHPDTGTALSEVARKGEKAIVLLNRRGWSNFLTCRDCGHVWCCPNCDVTLVLHMARGEIACHHCGHRAELPERCSECDSTAVSRFGAGTERLESELREVLGGRKDFEIVRLDADTAAREGVATLLGRFDRAASGVLIGTQMVAKGHDFPDVTLAVVVDADSTMRFPDFRAEERTFALVAQLAGRSGRSARGGRVLVQSASPEARPLEYAASHDAAGFLADELERREVFGYPPFSHLIRIVCGAEQASDARAAATAIADRAELSEGRVLGPVSLFKLKGRERFQLEVKAQHRAPAVASVRAALELVAAGPAGRNVTFSVDVDPQ